MQRRQFLLNSGILASAITLSPSSVLAGNKNSKERILIVYGTGNSRDMMRAVIKNSVRTHVPELSVDEIGELTYSSSGFLLKMNNGKQYLAEKIIFSSCNKIDISRTSVNISNGSGVISLDADTANGKNDQGPEFWAFSSAKKFDRDKIMPFIKRDKNAFMYIS